MLAFTFSLALVSCRDTKEKETKEVEGVEVEQNAKIETSSDGQKIEIEDSEKEVKIKKDENGNIEKKKIEYKDE